MLAVLASLVTVLGTFVVATGGYFAKRRIDAQDRVLDTLGNHEVRITVLEASDGRHSRH